MSRLKLRSTASSDITGVNSKSNKITNICEIFNKNKNSVKTAFENGSEIEKPSGQCSSKSLFWSAALLGFP